MRLAFHSFTEPSDVFMIFFWKMKNKMATGMVITVAAASLTGYWLPADSCPLANDATPLVKMVKLEDCVETMKCESSFHDPWNDRIAIVTSAGRAIITHKTTACLFHEYSDARIFVAECETCMTVIVQFLGNRRQLIPGLRIIVVGQSGGLPHISIDDQLEGGNILGGPHTACPYR